MIGSSYSICMLFAYHAYIGLPNFSFIEEPMNRIFFYLEPTSELIPKDLRSIFMHLNLVR